MSTPLKTRFEEYAWFGSGSGYIQRILSHPDFLPYSELARNFFIYACAPNAAANTLNTSNDDAAIRAWLSAVWEYESLALLPRKDVRTSPNPTPQLRTAYFDTEDAIRWASNAINVNYKLHDRFPTHPAVSWIKNKNCGPHWHAPQDGFLVSLYRRASITEKRRLIDEEIRTRRAQSDALLYVLFRVYAEAHCSPKSNAWKIAVDEVGQATKFGSIFSVMPQQWEDFRKRSFAALHT